MATLLFIVISFVFVGLGLPDSLFGAAWPDIYSDLNLPISYANYVTTLISVGTVLSSLFASQLVAKLGTGLVTALSTLLTTIMLLIFSLGDNIIFFCLLSIPLGLGAGAIDAALNNYIALNYSSTHMSFIHCFYGVGVSASPLLMSFALAQTDSWQGGDHIIAIVMATITLIAFLALPLWKKANSKKQEEKQVKEKPLSVFSLAKMPAVRVAWLVFFFTVALEFTCGIWGCTYLVQAEGMSESLAAATLTFYYLGITSGRAVSGVVSKWINPQKIVFFGYGIVALALVILFLPIPATFKGVALFMIGFGNGPTFPNLTFLTPRYFGQEISGSVIASQTACCNIGILLMPPVFGFLAEWLGVEIFPICLTILFAIMLVSTIIYAKRTRELITNKEKSKNC